MQILIDIHRQLLGGAHQRLKGIPSPNAFPGTCLQTHVPFADALSSSQLGRIVMQEDFGMDQHDEQVLLLGQRQRFSLVQLFIAGSLPEKLLKFSAQRVSIRLMRMLLLGLQLAVQLPETLLEVLQELAMVRNVWDQLLVMAKLMDPAER